jgi:hypothetical protein
MSNIKEELKRMGNRNCLNCNHHKLFKSSDKGYCQNPKSPMLNTITDGNLVCNEYEKSNDSEKKLL